jgi:hypothetical protein
MSATKVMTLIAETRERLSQMEALLEGLQKKKEAKKAKKAAKAAKEADSDSDAYLLSFDVPLPASPKADKPKRAASAWATMLKEVYAPLVKEALGDGVKMSAGLHLKVAGYLKKKGNEKPSLDDVKETIKFLSDNPDYKSDHAQKKSDSGSEASDKKRGRPKKVLAVIEEIDDE